MVAISVSSSAVAANSPCAKMNAPVTEGPAEAGESGGPVLLSDAEGLFIALKPGQP